MSPFTVPRDPFQHLPGPSGPESPGIRGSSAAPILVTERPDLLRQVEASAASLGVPVPVSLDPVRVPGRWMRAGMVLLGVDVAERIVAMGLPRRSRVHLLGGDTDVEVLVRHSAALEAAVLVLPRDGSVLSGLLLPVRPAAAAAPLVAVASGGGAPGASTTACGLAGAAAQRGSSVLLVDADPWAAGIDLLLGIEAEVGWRWPDLSGARGRLGALGGRLPRWGSVDVLAMARLGATHPEVGAVEAVLDSCDDYDLIIVDVPTCLGTVADLACERANHVVVTVGEQVRQLAAGRALVARLDEAGAPIGLALRAGAARGPGVVRGAAVPTDLVAETLAAPVLATLPDDRRLPEAATRGEPVWEVAGKPWRTACTTLLDAVAPAPEAVAA